MAKLKAHYICEECKTVHLQWNGRCSSCGSWNTLIETEIRDNKVSGAPYQSKRKATSVIFDSANLTSSSEKLKLFPTGSFEFDRALGGGIISGSVTLLGGEPGIGKSTLLTQFLGSASKRSIRCLYVSGEESEDQIASRIARVAVGNSSLGILIASDIDEILDQIRTFKPGIVVLDSIQTVSDREIGSAPGSVSQVRECASRLIDEAKRDGMALVLVGHVTKDGSLAGPRVLEHLVDTVAYFEGDRDSSLRILRVIKHRFGPVGDLGMFEMSNDGLYDLANASGLHLNDRVAGQTGSVVFPALDGRRVMLCEIQALVVPTSSEQPRRVVTGLEFNRVLLLLAVLEKKVGIHLHNKDVFLSVAGGVKLADPAADLAALAAVMSSFTEIPLLPNVIVVGEVGLGGEIRSASNISQRLTESARLGFPNGLIGSKFEGTIPNMVLTRASNLADALKGLSLTSGKSKSN